MDKDRYQNNDRPGALALLNSRLFCFKFSQSGLITEVYHNYIRPCKLIRELYVELYVIVGCPSPVVNNCFNGHCVSVFVSVLKALSRGVIGWCGSVTRHFLVAMESVFSIFFIIFVEFI